MQIIELYEIKRSDGGVTITPIPQDGIEPSKIRLVADDGMALTNGEAVTTVVDTDSVEGWTEIEAPADWWDETSPDEATEADYIEALQQLGVLE